jgi:O-antigen/teichoic acid export membrane protein
MLRTTMGYRKRLVLPNVLVEIRRRAQAQRGDPGTVRRRFSSAIAWNILASVVSRAMVLLAAIVCARYLGKDGYGRFGIVQTTANMVASLASLGLGMTATRYIADLREHDRERAGRIIGLTWTVTVVSAALATLISLLTARQMATAIIHAPELTGAVRIASALVFLNALLAYQNGALFGFEAFRKLAVINSIAGAAMLPMVLVGVWRWGLDGAVAGTAAALAINWWLNERLLHGECRREGIRIRIREGFRETTVFWRFSLPALLGAVVTAVVLWWCTVLIVRSPHGFAQMAMFSASDRWRLAILFIPVALFRSALPLMANLHEKNRAGYRQVARAHLVLNLMVILLPVAAICALAPFIMGMYGPGFRSGWPVLAVCCMATVPEALNTIFGYPLIATGRMWTRCMFDIALSAILLSLGLLLIPARGAMGYAIAYLITYSLISLGLYLVTRERAQEPQTAVLSHS